MFETGTEQYKLSRQLAHFRKSKPMSESTTEFENLGHEKQRRLSNLIAVQPGEKLLIASLYQDNWLLLSSRRIFYGTGNECIFALRYSEILECGWFVGDEEFSDQDIDGIPLKACPKLKILTRTGDKYTMLLEPGAAHNLVWNNIRFRVRLEVIHEQR